MKDELTLKANCVMQGNIYTTKLEIESQAKFNGSCNTNDMNQEVKLLEAVTE
ncbi:bactofilin family protein [Bacteroides stercorirosoris]|uniref:polymer-forming cytoskeletal protein n=1 Tax=Bacteroides stercorirosoris TaxID=871324 RepID=UPI000AE66B49|nr:polymer-forming cytoskeletal protein [Bacteroides stercorirosoris]